MTAKQTWVGELLSKFAGDVKGDAKPILDVLIEALCVPIDQAQAAIAYLRDNRSLDTAEGVWLDELGVILGVPRPLDFESDDNIFTYGDAYAGFLGENASFSIDIKATSGAALSLKCFRTGETDAQVADGDWQTFALTLGSTPEALGLYGDFGLVTGLRFRDEYVTISTGTIAHWFPLLEELVLDVA